MKNKNIKKVKIHLTEDELAKIDELAKNENRSRENFCENIIKKFVMNSYYGQYDYPTPTNYPITWTCLHNSCSECNGTGIKKNGGICIHNIACSCPKCSPTYITFK